MEKDKKTGSLKVRENLRFLIITGLISALFSTPVSALISSILIVWVRPNDSLILEKKKMAIVETSSYKDKNSLKWHYAIRPQKIWRWDDSFAYTYFVFEKEPSQEKFFDFSKIEEIRFAIKSTNENSKIDFNIFIYNKNSQYTEQFDVNTKWTPVSIKLGDLKRVYERDPQTPILNRVYGFGFALKSFAGLRSEEVSMDDITFQYTNGKEVMFDGFEGNNLYDFIDLNGVKGRWGDGANEEPEYKNY